jgi:general secretion pathway protein J
MSRPRARQRRADAGFTLFEALAAVALMGLIVTALANVTAQWLPSWNRGQVRAQRNEQVAVALDRLVADLSAAEYVWPNRASKVPLFRGDESTLIFVRSAVGPNSRPGLEIVQISETVDKNGRSIRDRFPIRSCCCARHFASCSNMPGLTGYGGMPGANPAICQPPFASTSGTPKVGH